MRRKQWAMAVSTAAALVALWATGTATAVPAQPPTASPAPQPHIIKTFANGLTGRRAALPKGPVASVPVRSDVDGCDRAYGEASQCVPDTLPRGQTDLCGYLAKNGLRAVRVHGTDVRNLDPNHNGIACD
jgi:hypothetical protein